MAKNEVLTKTLFQTKTWKCDVYLRNAALKNTFDTYSAYRMTRDKAKGISYLNPCHTSAVPAEFQGPLRGNLAKAEYAGIHPIMLNAILELAKQSASEIGIVSIGNGAYAAERKLSGDRTLLVRHYTVNGTISAAIVGADGRTTAPVSDPMNTVPAVGSELEALHECIYATTLCRLKDVYSDITLRFDAIAQDVAIGEDIYSEPYMAYYYLCDSIYFGLLSNTVGLALKGGYVGTLTYDQIRTGTANGTCLYGECPILMQNVTGTKAQKTVLTIGAVRKIQEFADWANAQVWTAEEEDLIPKFPDDYPVSEEVVKMCKRFVGTHGDRRPMVNFMWRGVTSYGKSTGVEMMASILHTPLLRQTCHSSMETQDFLSNIIPVDHSAAAPAFEIPSFDEIACDPDSAYAKITGKAEAGHSCDDCIAALANRPQQGGGSLFKQVESNFIKALSHGYIVEVQEISRIKDSGVLVGLNEYDRPGAIIPLVDGSYVRRHPNAMVVYTDNVGYASCRPVDPSVLRRMSFIIDSYDMPKEDALRRVVYNTGFKNSGLLDKLYNLWSDVKTYCADQDITEGTVSLTELEMVAQTVMADGYDNIEENFRDCVIAKATSVKEEQDALTNFISGKL